MSGGTDAGDEPSRSEEKLNGGWTAEEALDFFADLRGATLVWRAYNRPAEHWDHDHCAFCHATITDAPDTKSLTAAWTNGVTLPGLPLPPRPESGPYVVPAPPGTVHTWVCPTCAEDYRPVFGWHMVADENP